MFILLVIKALLLMIIIFFVVKAILDEKSNNFIKKKLGFISLNTKKKLNSVKFKWLTNQHANEKVFTLDNFDFFKNGGSDVDSGDDDKPVFVTAEKTVGGGGNKQTFDIFVNKTPVVSRDCLTGYEYTYLGCSKNVGCQGKGAYEYAVDKQNRYVIYKCDGNNNILETHTCYPNRLIAGAEYEIPNIACGNANFCFDKADGFARPDVSTKTYSYFICNDGIPVEKHCNKYDEYFDTIKLRCVLAPPQCRQLKSGESVVFLANYYTVCHKNEDRSLNVQVFKPDKATECITTGNCSSVNDKFAHSVESLTPSLWTSSQYYKKCVNNFWTIYFCHGDTTNVISSHQRDTLIQEMQNSFTDGMLYTLPQLDHINVFDEKNQICVNFDYIKHFNNQELPLVYTDPLMIADAKRMPLFAYGYKARTSSSSSSAAEAVPVVNLIAENNDSNKFLTINDGYSDLLQRKHDDGDSSLPTYNDRDRDMCSKNYLKYLGEKKLGMFLGVLTTVYSDVILSCRFGKPVWKMVVDKNANLNFWGTEMLKGDKYKLKKGKIIKCGKKKTLHKFIATCVDHKCSRADFIYPSNYFKSYPTLSVTYSNLYSFCTRNGNSLFDGDKSNLRPVKNSKLLKQLTKYCLDKIPGYWVHPYLNIPINCKQNKEAEILNDRSHRDESLKTLVVEPDSIFKDDVQALHLHFLPGDQVV